eukprot:CAMPEP_0176251636 /NCGR_PEP_ID=MMETSP0121_2-20121125/35099_1 /TAXON_ID=160619 /ORGANISM="Kryptoperidinium foliaceum, Strain CCMP 1326" /LENGTH=293 /DNA_ID=CAMNT_0017591381 /DNA_START=14 /DNA_END=893 /DNA_ORIENTATION=-
MVATMQIMPWVVYAINFFLIGFTDRPRGKLFAVMICLPLVMNTFQFVVTDSFIKMRAGVTSHRVVEVEHKHEEEEEEYHRRVQGASCLGCLAPVPLAKAAAMYWGEEAAEPAGLMSTIFGASTLGTSSQAAVPGQGPSQQTTVPGAQDVGASSSVMATLFGSTQPDTSRALVVQPSDGVADSAGALSTAFASLSGAFRSGAPSPSPRSASGTVAQSAMGSRFPMYSAVGQGPQVAFDRGGRSFGPPPMISRASSVPEKEARAASSAAAEALSTPLAEPSGAGRGSGRRQSLKA